jgi:shikimate 5-dehydrogenase
MTNQEPAPWSFTPALGRNLVDGVEMLVQLAIRIFERSTGVSPEESVFQDAVAWALGEDSA